MKKEILMVGVLLLISIMIAGCSNELNGNEVSQYDEFANCLTEKGVKIYGTEWCPHCKNQKEMFGNSFQYVDYIDCDKNKDECNEAGIEGYPTWIINGEKYPGERSLNSLSSLTDCPL